MEQIHYTTLEVIPSKYIGGDSDEVYWFILDDTINQNATPRT